MQSFFSVLQYVSIYFKIKFGGYVNPMISNTIFTLSNKQTQRK